MGLLKVSTLAYLLRRVLPRCDVARKNSRAGFYEAAISRGRTNFPFAVLGEREKLGSRVTRTNSAKTREVFRAWLSLACARVFLSTLSRPCGSDSSLKTLGNNHPLRAESPERETLRSIEILAFEAASITDDRGLTGLGEIGGHATRERASDVPQNGPSRNTHDAFVWCRSKSKGICNLVLVGRML